MTVFGNEERSDMEKGEHSTNQPIQCVYDTNNDGDCQYCARRGGCKNMGGPYTFKMKYPPGTPDSAIRGFEPK